VPRVVRTVAERERRRLSRIGEEIIELGPPPKGARAALADQGFRRDLRWLAVHGTWSLLISVFGMILIVNGVEDFTYPMWYRMLPGEPFTPSFVPWTVSDNGSALAVGLYGLVWAVCFLIIGPGMAWLQAWPGRRLLTPTADTDLSVRIAQLSATRAAALDAHVTELRRIERSLHDGAQNRLVAVTVLLGATRRALARDPATAEAALDRAQDAAEQALAELRTVVRSILPPVLADRGFAESLAGLAADCAVPCRIDVDVPGRCAASVEATAYFVIAEALTNVAKHSQARNAAVIVRRHGDRLLLRVHDDGIGGADQSGSGLAGIRGRIEAHDGLLTVTSPPGGPTTLQAELPCGL
jgi:signal transduction histidine kinase